MPYITSKDRPCFQNTINKLSSLKSPGELNYVLTLVCKKYMKEHSENYQTFNDIVGALECCKQEFYGRVVAPYEDEKIQQNGDVY